jgi:NAD(P)-dependent dehydrogenase (short-subunit alcohol dehydrogenase family)
MVVYGYMNIQDKVIIVTGASMGIGAAAAKLLAKHGGKSSFSRSVKGVNR